MSYATDTTSSESGWPVRVAGIASLGKKVGDSVGNYRRAKVAQALTAARRTASVGRTGVHMARSAAPGMALSVGTMFAAKSAVALLASTYAFPAVATIGLTMAAATATTGIVKSYLEIRAARKAGVDLSFREAFRSEATRKAMLMGAASPLAALLGPAGAALTLSAFPSVIDGVTHYFKRRAAIKDGREFTETFFNRANFAQLGIRGALGIGFVAAGGYVLNALGLDAAPAAGPGGGVPPINEAPSDISQDPGIPDPGENPGSGAGGLPSPDGSDPKDPEIVAGIMAMAENMGMEAGMEIPQNSSEFLGKPTEPGNLLSPDPWLDPVSFGSHELGPPAPGPSETLEKAVGHILADKNASDRAQMLARESLAGNIAAQKEIAFLIANGCESVDKDKAISTALFREVAETDLEKVKETVSADKFRHIELAVQQARRDYAHEGLQWGRGGSLKNTSAAVEMARGSGARHGDTLADMWEGKRPMGTPLSGDCEPCGPEKPVVAAAPSAATAPLENAPPRTAGAGCRLLVDVNNGLAGIDCPDLQAMSDGTATLNINMLQEPRVGDRITIPVSNGGTVLKINGKIFVLPDLAPR